MKTLLIVSFILNSIYTLADEPVYKSWKNFKSDHGYQFEYPDCWKVVSDDINGEGPIKEHAIVAVFEDGGCVTPRKSKYINNGMNINALEDDLKETEIIKMIEEKVRASKIYLKNGTWLSFKKFKLHGEADVLAYVESFKNKDQNFIRWRHYIFCNNRLLVVTGPAFDDHPKEILKKLKQGDLSSPEPYNTIFNSIKCTDSKIKK